MEDAVSSSSNTNTNNNNDNTETNEFPDDDDEIKEIEAAEKVINSLRYYKKYCMIKLKRQADAIMELAEEDRRLLIGSITEHMRKVRDCVEENQKLFEMIVHCGANIFGGSVQKAFEMNKVHPSTEHYMTKVKSTLKQIVRDWSEEGSAERNSCYNLVFEKTKQLFPSEENRHSTQILVTGAGLARLAWDLRKIGFSVTGNEFSYFMLLASNFILNSCQQEEEFTIYPYVLDFSNSWSFRDQLKAVKFPDVNPAFGLGQEDSSDFSMCAGDFLQVYANSNDQFDIIISVFFIDTGPNPLEYIRLVHRILKQGGYWLNFGPLTYHHEDSQDTLSLELPFQTILNLVEKCGFKLEEVKGKGELPPSQYTCNPDSMLQYHYFCGYFMARKINK